MVRERDGAARIPELPTAVGGLELVSALEPVGLFFEGTPTESFGRLGVADIDAGGGLTETSRESDNSNESEQCPALPRDSASLGRCDVLEPGPWPRLQEYVRSGGLSGAVFGYRLLCEAKLLGGLDSGLLRWALYESVAEFSG